MRAEGEIRGLMLVNGEGFLEDYDPMRYDFDGFIYGFQKEPGFRCFVAGDRDFVDEKGLLEMIKCRPHYAMEYRVEGDYVYIGLEKPGKEEQER